jgi:hypothetical protein
MLEIFVGNKSKGHTGYYCGRPSPLGNPFKIGADGDRDMVVDNYAVYLLNNYRNSSKIKICIDRLVDYVIKYEKYTLVCWCSPDRCHADVIAELVKQLLEERGYDVRITKLS